MTDDERVEELYQRVAKSRPTAVRDEASRAVLRSTLTEILALRIYVAQLESRVTDLAAEVNRLRDRVGPGPCR